jgi:hypothetical protein
MPGSFGIRGEEMYENEVWQVQILKSDDGNSNIENVYES